MDRETEDGFRAEAKELAVLCDPKRFDLTKLENVFFLKLSLAWRRGRAQASVERRAA